VALQFVNVVPDISNFFPLPIHANIVPPSFTSDSYMLSNKLFAIYISPAPLFTLIIFFPNMVISLTYKLLISRIPLFISMSPVLNVVSDVFILISQFNISIDAIDSFP
jgi:hypothetical protein